MFRIPHFSCKPRKLVGQNKVQIRKLKVKIFNFYVKNIIFLVMTEFSQSLYRIFEIHFGALQIKS